MTCLECWYYTSKYSKEARVAGEEEIRVKKRGLPWWLSGKESACQCQRVKKWVDNEAKEVIKGQNMIKGHLCHYQIWLSPRWEGTGGF